MLFLFFSSLFFCFSSIVFIIHLIIKFTATHTGYTYTDRWQMKVKPNIKCISKVHPPHAFFVFSPFAVGYKDDNVARSFTQSIPPSITLAKNYMILKTYISPRNRDIYSQFAVDGFDLNGSTRHHVVILCWLWYFTVLYRFLFSV